MLVGKYFDLPVVVELGDDGDHFDVVNIFDENTVSIQIEGFDCEDKAKASARAINNHDKMAEMLALHRSIFVHMLENIPATATIEDVEKVQGLVAQIDEVLGHE